MRIEGVPGVDADGEDEVEGGEIEHESAEGSDWVSLDVWGDVNEILG